MIFFFVVSSVSIKGVDCVSQSLTHPDRILSTCILTYTFHERPSVADTYIPVSEVISLFQILRDQKFGFEITVVSNEWSTNVRKT